MFAVLVQASAAFLAHRVAQSAVTAAAARVAIAPNTADAAAAALAASLETIVPGGREADVAIEVGPRVVTVSARFLFVPPGPMFRSIDMEVSSDAPIVVDP